MPARLFLIRKAQLDALDQDALKRAVAELRVHARKHFGDLLGALPDDKVERALHRMVAEAQSLGLLAMREVMLFVNLSLLHGEGFLARAELSWMQAMLTDPAIATPADRVRHLYAEVLRRRQ